MPKKSNPPQDKKIACKICLKEIPLSEAKSVEAVDYVAHFCGLDCYDQWKKKSDKSVLKSGAAKKR